MTLTFDDPAVADNFRMTKDWGRWYFDPLPACDIAPATEDSWPSCSQVKKAADKDWSFLTVNRIAALDPFELHRIAELDVTQRGDAIRSHEKFARNTAFGRGTIVHLWIEDLAAGRDPREITNQWLALNNYPEAARTEAKQYRTAIVDFWQTHQPEPVALEYVTIHRTLNGHGYGATPDGLVRIEGELAAVDWKTRGAGSSHAAYAEEAAQIACGARAEYMVVRRDGAAVRQHIPPVAGGYVVSIKPDGARLYPIDIDKAWTHWTRLHEWWCHRLDEKASIGRVRPKKAAKIAPVATAPTGSTVEQPAPEPAPPAGSGAGTIAGEGTGSADGLGRVVSSQRADHSASATSGSPPHPPDPLPALRQRYQALSEAEQAAFRLLKIDRGDWAAIEEALDSVDAFNQTVAEAPPQTHKTVPAPRPQPPDEGAPVADTDVEALKKRFNTMAPAAKTWAGALPVQSNGGHCWRINERSTVRRYELHRGVFALAEWMDWGAARNTNILDDIVRAIVHQLTGEKAALFPTTTPGVALGLLDAGQAAQFASVVQDLTQGRVAVLYGDDGRCRLEPVA